MIRNTQESFDAKAKGEKFQKDLVALIQEVLPEHKDVIVSSPMSAHRQCILGRNLSPCVLLRH